MADVGGYDKDALLNQAQNIWTMLDEMAASDPNAYKAFIDKQIKEGRQTMAPPKPHMCVKTLMMKPKKMPFFINFCSWDRVPAPKSPEDAVPVTGSKVQQIEDEDGLYSTASCAFNPKVLEEYGLDTKSPVDRDTLINLAIDFLHHNYNIELSRKYLLLPRDTSHKGDLKVIQRAFTEKTNSSQQFENQLTELEKSFGPLPMGAKDTLLHKLANMSTDDSTATNSTPSNSQSNGFSAKTVPDIKLPMSEPLPSKKHLIEEISPQNGVSELPAPNYTMDTRRSNDGECLVVMIDLPGVRGVADCQLDISEDDLQLHVEDRYDLHLAFPYKITDDEAGAKFNKKTSSLIVTLPKPVCS